MKINENKIKKFTLLAAILAPMIYLFGSLFAALQGSHGNIVLASSKTEDSVSLDVVYNNTNIVDYSVGDTFAMSNDSRFFVVDIGTLPAEHFTLNTKLASNGNYTIIGVADGLITYSQQVWIDSYYFNPDATNYYYLRCYKSYFIDQSFSLGFTDGQFSDYLSSVSYSDYLFHHFFVGNNFLSESGRNVIKGTPDYGFAPAAEMIRYIDSNMLHLANVDWGYLVIGYVYYAFHVTIVFLMFELLMFFPHLIENIYDKFERGV